MKKQRTESVERVRTKVGACRQLDTDDRQAFSLDLTWAAFQDILLDTPIISVTTEVVEGESPRFFLTKTWTSFDSLVKQIVPWRITYFRSQVLAAVPSDVWPEFMLHLHDHVCGKGGLSENIFNMTYVAPACRFGHDARGRWTIPASLNRSYLKIDPYDKCDLTLRPHMGWIEIMRTEFFETEHARALAEAEAAFEKSGFPA